MSVTQFVPSHPYTDLINGDVSYTSPSNIALVKYWGKRDEQIPENPSISFTLNNCKTETKITYTTKDSNDGFSFDVFLEGENTPAFKPKIETFFKRILAYLPFLNKYHFKIETSNTFPHSSGIASSASGMSALAMCLMDIEQTLLGDKAYTEEAFIQKASFLARLGSGSACRSLEGDIVVWGKTEAVESSSDLYGVKYPYTVHDNFKNYQDTILLVDKGEKQVSSTVGHNLMHGHPFAKERFKQADENLHKIKDILASGNLEAFIELIESEALTLHAMMMTSLPYFILMKPKTLEVINKIWAFRKSTNVPVGFTLDAGANVHVLYPEKDKQTVLEFINNELVAYCQNGHYICDTLGLGAKKL